MRLYVLGSGSRGNCCAVEAEGSALLLDAGFSAREIERRAELAGLDLDRVVGHRAHARARRPRVRRAAPRAAPGRSGAHRGRHLEPPGAAVWARPATADRAPWRRSSWARSGSRPAPRVTTRRTRSPSRCGSADGTGVGVAYDLGRPTTAVRYLLRDLTALVLEANYDEVALRTSGYPPVVQRRIAGSGGPPLQSCGRRAAGRAAPPRPRGRGAGPPEPALQHGRRRPRRRRPRAPARGLRRGRCTWPRRTSRLPAIDRDRARDWCSCGWRCRAGGQAGERASGRCPLEARPHKLSSRAQRGIYHGFEPVHRSLAALGMTGCSRSPARPLALAPAL